MTNSYKMYDKLRQKSTKVHHERLMQIYTETNEDIDQSEAIITRLMSEGKMPWAVFNEPYKNNTDYDKLFTEFCKPPYDKPILTRLREKYPLPEFRCDVHHVHYSTHDFINPDSPDVNYYEVYVEWGNFDECKCVVF